MKNIFRILFLLVVSSSIFACESEMMLYNYEVDRLGFDYDRNDYGTVTDSMTRYSFTYEPDLDATVIVYVDVLTSGFIYDYDRPFTIQQVDYTSAELDTVMQAVPGVHYVAFDDAQVKDEYVVKAGKNMATVPIILLRDSDLEFNDRYLKIEIVDNEYFEVSYEADRYKSIQISDGYVKPVLWTTSFQIYLGGVYGTTKHWFMQLISMEYLGVVFDDTFMETYFFDMGSNDDAFEYWFRDLLIDELKQHNAERKAEGLDVLTEDDGTIVQFNILNVGQPYEY